MPPFALIWRDPALRMVAVLMVLQGALMCTFGPFVSVLAVRAFGLGDAGYAAVMVTSTLVSVTTALYSGIRADQTANRREIALFSGMVTVVGVGVIPKEFNSSSWRARSNSGFVPPVPVPVPVPLRRVDGWV